MHLLLQVGKFVTDDRGGKFGQEAALEFGAGTVNTDFVVGRFGEQQKAVIGDTAALHVGSDDAGGLADGVGEVGTVGTDDQRQVGRVQPVEPAPDANHPFAMLDVEFAVALPDLRDVGDVALHQGQQILAHLVGHVRVEPRQRCGQGVVSCGGDGGEVQNLAVTTVKHKGIFIGLEAAHQRIHRAVTIAEDRLHLSFDLERVIASGVGVVIKTGTAAMGVALGIMVRDERQGASSLFDHAPYMICQYCPEVRPTQVEAPAEIAEWQDDAGRRAGGHRDVDASIHAIERDDGGWVLCDIEAARQKGFRTLECHGVASEHDASTSRSVAVWACHE